MTRPIRLIGCLVAVLGASMAIADVVPPDEVTVENLAVSGSLSGQAGDPVAGREAFADRKLWSLISPENGVKVGARYEAGEDGTITGISSFISDTGETEDVREATYLESLGWYDSITADMFG